ncbi:lipoate--protein ligase [bacterium]|nr:lipoate--protein ligase [bacterium]
MSDQKIQTRVIRSRSFDPWHNLALEEALLGDVTPNEVILYLWQNENTVVIGRNQNAWQECRWKELEADNGKLARRLSGGGAVYHDLGNLNFTFVMDKKLFDLHRQLEVILGAVKRLGVDAKFSGRNDLVSEDGRKFSGNAFHHTNDAAYHHGTLMLDVDFSKLSQYLQVSQEKMKSKGVTSVKARVVNLAELSDQVSLEPLMDALRESFIEVYGGDGEELLPSDITTDLTPLYEKYSSWEWRYGRTPKFDVNYSTRFTWGGIDMGFSLEDGRVAACTIYSDAMDSALIQEIAARLEQIPFRIDAIIEKLENIEVDEAGKEMLQELADWLRTLSI